MSNKNAPPMPETLFTAPFVMGKIGFDMALTTAVSLARVAQIAMQSADTALGKYIELTEQEIKRSQRKESVKVE
jgi:hypothetical protein